MGESYMYQRLAYTRGEEVGEEEEEDEEERDGGIRENVRGQMVRSGVVVAFVRDEDFTVCDLRVEMKAATVQTPV